MTRPTIPAAIFNAITLHEAGHAVCAAAVGVGVELAEVWLPDGGRLGGNVRLSSSMGDADPLDVAAIGAAGLAAEEHLMSRAALASVERFSRSPAGIDLRSLLKDREVVERWRSIAALLGDPVAVDVQGWGRAAYGLARTIIGKHQAAVLELAYHLSRRRRMTGVEIAAVLERYGLGGRLDLERLS